MRAGKRTEYLDPLLKLQSWLSPAFPVGGFSYSHGLENAHEEELVGDAETLRVWLDGILTHGSGRADAMLLVAAWRAADGHAALAEIVGLAAALRGSAELMRETENQGKAFLATVRAAWPHPRLDEWHQQLGRDGRNPALPVAVGVVSAIHAVPADLAAPLYLQAFAASVISAGVRLIPLGQTEAQRITAALAPTVASVATEALAADPRDLGSATLTVDLCSMRHETQYTRLFRS